MKHHTQTDAAAVNALRAQFGSIHIHARGPEALAAGDVLAAHTRPAARWGAARAEVLGGHGVHVTLALIEESGRSPIYVGRVTSPDFADAVEASGASLDALAHDLTLKLAAAPLTAAVLGLPVADTAAAPASSEKPRGRGRPRKAKTDDGAAPDATADGAAGEESAAGEEGGEG